MVTCQSANQLKTPAKVSWAFKMVSQFGSLGYTIMGKTADLTVVQKTIIGKSVEEKDAQPTERTAALWGLSSKIDFKNLGELRKEWTEAGVKASRATTHRRVKEFGYICRQRRLTWAKEKKNWTVAQWSKVQQTHQTWTP